MKQATEQNSELTKFKNTSIEQKKIDDANMQKFKKDAEDLKLAQTTMLNEKKELESKKQELEKQLESENQQLIALGKSIETLEKAAENTTSVNRIGGAKKMRKTNRNIYTKSLKNKSKRKYSKK